MGRNIESRLRLIPITTITTITIYHARWLHPQHIVIIRPAHWSRSSVVADAKAHVTFYVCFHVPVPAISCWYFTQCSIPQSMPRNTHNNNNHPPCHIPFPLPSPPFCRNLILYTFPLVRHTHTHDTFSHYGSYFGSQFPFYHSIPFYLTALFVSPFISPLFLFFTALFSGLLGSYFWFLQRDFGKDIHLCQRYTPLPDFGKDLHLCMVVATYFSRCVRKYPSAAKLLYSKFRTAAWAARVFPV